MKLLHRRGVLTFFTLACGACLAIGCAQILGIENLPGECNTNAECDTPQRPFWTCNQTTHACEPPSAGNGCQADIECRADAPICGDDSKCRGCAGNNECNSTAPICGANGQCMASCMSSADCSGVTPICNLDNGACEACNGDGVCEDLGNGAPDCATEEPNAGACVACLDDNQCAGTAETPICGDDNACRGCQDHGECGSTVCDRGTGACVAENAVAYVTADGTGDCSRAAPCGTVAAALDFIRANNEARYVVRLDDGTYTGQVVLDDITVQIIGDGATVQLDGTPANAPVINVATNADVTLEGLTIRGASGTTNADGVRCAGGGSSSLHVLRSTVTGNAAVGINASDCALTVARSAILSNPGGGIRVRDSAFDITNSYILDNGDVRNSAVAGVAISNGVTFSPQRFAFNTVADNEAGPDAEAGGVFCDISATSNAAATSNIILEGFGGKPSVGGDCTWAYSNIEGKDGGDIDDAIVADPNNIDANCMLTNRDDGLRAIGATSACIGTGEDNTGILDDYDGAARPATDPDMGADEL